METDSRQHSGQIAGTGSQPGIARLVEAVADNTGSPLAMAYLVLGGTLVVLACLGADPITAGDHVEVDESLSGEVVRTGLPLIIGNVAGDPVLAGRDLVRSHDIKSYAGFPVRGEDGQVVAVLAVAAHRAQQWTPRQLRYLDDVAQMLADLLSCGDAPAAVPKSPVLRGESRCSRVCWTPPRTRSSR